MMVNGSCTWEGIGHSIHCGSLSGQVKIGLEYCQPYVIHAEDRAKWYSQPDLICVAESRGFAAYLGCFLWTKVECFILELSESRQPFFMFCRMTNVQDWFGLMVIVLPISMENWLQLKQFWSNCVYDCVYYDWVFDVCW